jgi:hypothetical protein
MNTDIYIILEIMYMNKDSLIHIMYKNKSFFLREIKKCFEKL